MSDRSLRGMRLGAQSLESEAGVEPAARQRVEYRTEDGEQVFVTFSVEADVPATWTSKTGKEAFLVDGEKPEIGTGEQAEAIVRAVRGIAQRAGAAVPWSTPTPQRFLVVPEQASDEPPDHPRTHLGREGMPLERACAAAVRFCDSRLYSSCVSRLML